MFRMILKFTLEIQPHSNLTHVLYTAIYLKLQKMKTNEDQRSISEIDCTEGEPESQASYI
jgi:hypothetical protein